MADIMMPIHKCKNDPLSGFKQFPDAKYEDIRFPKDDLCKSLLLEQGYLCAYCIARITRESMSVEHWMPQNPSSGEAISKQEAEELRMLGIEYKNMLAVCGGNEGNHKKLQHCDTLKGSKILKYNPANPDHHQKLRIRYIKITGKIESQDDEFNRQIGGVNGDPGVLNLNLEQIKRNRLEVIKRVTCMLGRLRENASGNDVRRLLDAWQKPDAQGRLPAYAGVAIFFLERRLRHSSRS